MEEILAPSIQKSRHHNVSSDRSPGSHSPQVSKHSRHRSDPIPQWLNSVSALQVSQRSSPPLLTRIQTSSPAGREGMYSEMMQRRSSELYIFEKSRGLCRKCFFCCNFGGHDLHIDSVCLSKCSSQLAWRCAWQLWKMPTGRVSLDCCIN